MRTAGQERALVAFIRAKQAAGVISAEDAQAIEAIRENLYRQQGIMDNQKNLHSLTEFEAMGAVHRQGLHLMETKLLELYPALEDEVRKLRSPDHPR